MLWKKFPLGIKPDMSRFMYNLKYGNYPVSGKSIDFRVLTRKLALENSLSHMVLQKDNKYKCFSLIEFLFANE